MAGKTILSATVLIVAIVAVPAFAAINVHGADGLDGAFAFVADAGDPDRMTIDLGLAETLPLNSGLPYAGPPATPGNGVYDPTRWAVVFRYTEVVVPVGKTVTFTNHSSGAPVVWLVSGNVTVSGTLNVSGAHQTGTSYTQAEPGPGGWRGGRAFRSNLSLGSAGFGPGGGTYQPGQGAQASNSGSYSTTGRNQNEGPVYGNASVLPLIGGSGGGANYIDYGGGAGGGAMLIASSTTIDVSGAILANGGDGLRNNSFCNAFSGAGSGGAIRIVGDVVVADGTLSADGGLACTTNDGGFGRIRIEANQTNLGGSSISPGNAPGYSEALPADPVPVWPAADAPTVRITQVDQLAVPPDPRPLENWEFPDADVTVEDVSTATLTIECTNVPVPGDPEPWEVMVRVLPKTGYAQELLATYQSGDQSQSTWTVQIDTPPGHSSIQARAYLPPSP